jgi:hypothetical protein
MELVPVGSEELETSVKRQVEVCDCFRPGRSGTVHGANLVLSDELAAGVNDD